MNGSNTEFVHRTSIENSESDISEAVIREKGDINDSSFIPMTKAIKVVVKIA